MSKRRRRGLKRSFPNKYAASYLQIPVINNKFVMRGYQDRIRSMMDGESVPPTKGFGGTPEEPHPLLAVKQKLEKQPEFVWTKYVEVGSYRMYFDGVDHMFVRIVGSRWFRSIIYRGRDRALQAIRHGHKPTFVEEIEPIEFPGSSHISPLL